MKKGSSAPHLGMKLEPLYAPASRLARSTRHKTRRTAGAEVAASCSLNASFFSLKEIFGAANGCNGLAGPVMMKADAPSRERENNDAHIAVP